jgi:hypothetical protein
MPDELIRFPEIAKIFRKVAGSDAGAPLPA